MPAIAAGTALLGIIGFIVCGFSTWVLFQKRTELAIRTLSGSYVGQLEQSQLDPLTKGAVIREVELLIADMQRGKYENWQSAGIMQRLQRLPVLQWGELQAIETFLQNADQGEWSDEEKSEGLKQVGRLYRAVELGKVTSFDCEEVLKPIRTASNSVPGTYELALPLQPGGVRKSIQLSKELADRSGVPDESFADVRIERLLRNEIELGVSQGGF